MESWQQGGFTYYRLTGPLVPGFVLNQFVYLDGAMPLVAQVRELNGRIEVAKLEMQRRELEQCGQRRWIRFDGTAEGLPRVFHPAECEEDSATGQMRLR